MKKYIYISIAFLTTPLFKVFADWRGGIDTARNEFDLPDNTPEDVLLNFLEWTTMILAVVATLAFVISGIMLITSGGNPEQINKAKDFIKYSIIGLIVSLSAHIIIIFIADILII